MKKYSKRLFDLFFSFIGIILLLPIIIVISILIKLKMPDGQVFFLQDRVGQYGNIFKIIKFRTMINSHSGSSISVKGESRITNLGAVLRRYKLDELPELINVILGQMSLVGPRPDVPEYMDELKGEERKILDLKPGITSPATLIYAREEEILSKVPDPIKYNNEIIFPDKVKINLQYYYNNTLFGDLAIIFKTIFRR